MEESTQDTLTFELNNKRPVELADYTLSMLCVAKEFSRFVSESDGEADGSDIKLYIGQIREGSIITELHANAPVIIPLLLDQGKALFEYASFLKKAYEFFLGKEKTPPQVLEKKTLENLSQIIEPVCKDNGSQFNISTTINNYAPITIQMSSLEANAAQNQIKTYLGGLKETVTGSHDKVVMRLFQARNDQSSHGDRAIIESIYRGSVRISFADDAMKMLVLHPSSGNPFDHVYVVNVIVETVLGKPALYKITHVHESMSQQSLGLDT